MAVTEFGAYNKYKIVFTLSSNDFLIVTKSLKVGRPCVVVHIYQPHSEG